MNHHDQFEQCACERVREGCRHDIDGQWVSLMGISVLKKVHKVPEIEESICAMIFKDLLFA